MSDSHYQVVLADTVESKNIHYNLRYKIYCLEKGFEQAEKFKDEMEKDAYDDTSIHFIVKSNDCWIGAFRLVIDQFGNLPFQKVTEVNATQIIQNQIRAAEISRFGILRPFQSLKNGQPQLESSTNESELMLKLLQAARDYCLANDIGFIISLCKRSMARVISKFGLQAQPLGPAIDYKGMRFPFAINLDEIHAFNSLVKDRLTGQMAYTLYSKTCESTTPQSLAA
jgi:N-acyl amino acid synthase of PEP-CTERM/exosortase system